MTRSANRHRSHRPLLLAFAATFACQTAAVAEDPGFAPAVGLRTVVVDATGKVLGPVLAPGVVSFRVGPQGDLVKIGITRRGFSNNESLRFDYASKDCSGQAYLAFPGLIRAAYLDPTMQGAIVYPAGPLRVLHAKSYKTVTGECFPMFRDLPRLVGIASNTTMSQLGFAPPFAVKRQ